jgi:3-oxoadipate enol-lactonase
MKIKTNGVELDVTLAGSGATTLLYLHYWGGSARTWQPVVDALPGGYADSVGAALDHVLSAGPLPPALRSQVVEDSLRGAHAAKRAWPHGAMAQDITARARRIAVPVTVVSGELDRVDPPAALLTHLLPFIPHAVLETVPGRGHLLPLEAPQAVAHAIRRFVADLPPA